MKYSPVIFIHPGWGDSGLDHWQSRWLKKYPNAVKVEQEDWMNPRKDDWVETLNETLNRYKDRDVIFVGHSLACPMLAHYAQRFGSNSPIKAALLVAPGDADAPNFPSEMQGFSPIPFELLPFKSILVASDNDQWVSLERAKLFAESWGSEFVLIPGASHINVDVGFGEWPEGERLLQRLL